MSFYTTTDPYEIWEEWSEIDDYLVTKLGELSEKVDDNEILTSAEFREYEQLFGYLEQKIIVAEDQINPNTIEYQDWVKIIRHDEINNLAWEIGISADDLRHCGPLIDEYGFVDYAEDFAYEIGAINDESSDWPNYCIDWEQAARDLAMDYSLVEWEGNMYYVRY